MVVDTTIVGFGLDGASAVLADGVEFIKGVPGRVVFDPAPEVVESAFVMRSVPGIVRIYRVDSSGPDCNLDGIPDYEEIAAGAPDTNANGVPDTCECFADVNQDGVVNGADISAVLGFWGQAGKPLPAADITRDGLVDGADLAVLLGSWGPCQ